MASGTSTNQQDISAYKRKLPRELSGAYLLDEYRLNSRYTPKGYLPRNKTRFLDVHQKRCAQDIVHTKSSKDQSLQNVGPEISTVQNMRTGQTQSTTALPNGGSQVKSVLNGMNGASIKQNSDEFDTSIPSQQAMSSEALLVKKKKDPYDSGSRRFSRRQLGKVEHDDNAVLSIDLANMRKKLNWKTNKRSEPEQPRKKRARFDNIICHAHLTIWDNSPGKRESVPIVTETEMCEVIRDTHPDNPVVGKFVEVKLEQPFLVPKKKLRVPVQNKGVAGLAMAPGYFMEIKIVPARVDADWPPIPMLGKSEGDQMAKMDELVKDGLQDSLVARYHHLTPDADTPLSIFYYDDGISHRTKYGLELDAKWVTSDAMISAIKTEETSQPKLQIEPWMLDQEEKPFGRVDVSKTKVRNPRAVRKPIIPDAQPKMPTPVITRKPKVKYKFGGFRLNGAQKDFREMTLEDFTCPICPVNPKTTLELLLLHLENDHHKNEYTLEQTDVNGTEVTGATILVQETQVTRPRHRDRLDKQHEHQLSWIAPAAPFDIHRHTIDGDRSWIGDDSKFNHRKQAVHGSSVVAKPDKSTALRKANNGFLPSEHVQPFRPNKYKRKKYPNTRLQVRTDQSRPCTSISHRLITPEHADEDARSETDDEADDSWFTSRYLEELDIYARENSWSDAKSRLMKKWGYHVLYRERCPYSRYMSDCLIRFVRIEKQWILRRGNPWFQDPNRDQFEAESIDALQNLMNELLEKKVIDQRVCDDVAAMLDADDRVMMIPEEEHEIRRQNRERQNLKDAARTHNDIIRSFDGIRLTDLNAPLWKLSPNVCGGCRTATRSGDPHRTRCSNLDCSIPGVYYCHRCADFNATYPAFPSRSPQARQASLPLVSPDAMLKDRLAWKCPTCRKNEKGKQPAAPLYIY